MRHGLPLLLAGLLVSNAWGAGDGKLDRETLRGVKAVSVVIDDIAPWIAEQGLRPDPLREEIEGRLRRAGLAIDANAKEFVALRVVGVHAKKGPFALSFTLGLYQPVLLSRDQTVRTATQTWEVVSVLLAEPKAVSGSAMETVDEVTGRFVEAWRSVN
jgi:hypothetical protein